MNTKQIKDLIERILTILGMNSESAVNLLLGTAAQESNFKYIRQLGHGPALGIFQMEPATEHDIWNNYLIYKPKLADLICQITGHKQSGSHLEWDLAYQIIMCRLHYRRVKEALPEPDDINGLAKYWKVFYNTKNGKGTSDEFIENYKKYIGE